MAKEAQKRQAKLRSLILAVQVFCLLYGPGSFAAGKAPASKAGSSTLEQNQIEQSQPEKAPETSRRIEIDQLEKMLSEGGIKGEIHAADPINRQFVLTYRDPHDFFSNIQIGIVSHKKEVLDFFNKMKRHDFVLVKGEMFHRGEFFEESRQPHIEVKSIEMLKAYEAPLKAPQKYEKTTKLPDDLKDRSQANFLVHAVLQDGAFLVLEYKDNFVFVIVSEQKYSKELFRNDRISMRYKIQSHPLQPVHLELDTDTDNGKIPLQVLDSIKALHGQAVTQEGYLVRYPKSPQINRDIWAVEQSSPEGNSRTFTLVNFQKPGKQSQIDTKLKAWWDANPQKVVDGRNRLINKQVRIRAKGIMNVVDPNQANPQLQLEAEDLQLLHSDQE